MISLPDSSDEVNKFEILFQGKSYGTVSAEFNGLLSRFAHCFGQIKEMIDNKANQGMEERAIRYLLVSISIC